MTDLPFMAVGNDELGETVGDTATCPNCGEQHTVEYGEKVTRDPVTGAERREPSRLLGFVKCGEAAYLVAVNGKSLP